MTHPTEEHLIAYHLHEAADEHVIRQHLESCDPCAVLSESIAETLRVFSAEPVPEANLERNWHRLRINLPAITPARKRSLISWRRMVPSAAFAVATLVLVTFLGLHTKQVKPALRPNLAINGHGPLTTEPVDPAIANHLDTAERLLTEVNHTSGPLDAATRMETRDLLLKNAVYVKTARQSGNISEAAVLENLGRVLTTLDHEPEHEVDAGNWQLRFALNTDGLLLDIRILRQNDQRQ
ncbi:hypothetical protein [Granulicella sibirica]|uniref:Uncharacterized protein n=1 Tax=Granulicella sibirica TaxID=2479048 RepID=A0A4Q0SZ02_9BACT|nr:hypothetical protein [Granulicella sibirica]RXH56465.1 hypothetical protein GRAN_3322 [Granulicella sibirica]